MKLREVNEKIEGLIERRGQRMDEYTLAHLVDAQSRIEKGLDALYVYDR